MSTKVCSFFLLYYASVGFNINISQIYLTFLISQANDELYPLLPIIIMPKYSGCLTSLLYDPLHLIDAIRISSAQKLWKKKLLPRGAFPCHHLKNNFSWPTTIKYLTCWRYACTDSCIARVLKHPVLTTTQKKQTCVMFKSIWQICQWTCLWHRSFGTCGTWNAHLARMANFYSSFHGLISLSIQNWSALWPKK